MELETLNEYRFYKLEAIFPSRCTFLIDDVYNRPHGKRICHGLLNLHMTGGSINMRCPHVGCHKQYEITRKCNVCGKVTSFEDTICDGCEPRVINIATWSVSIQEGLKAIKKINRAFKNDLIKEKEWKTVLQINQDEVTRCEKLLEKEGISLQSTS